MSKCYFAVLLLLQVSIEIIINLKKAVFKVVASCRLVEVVVVMIQRCLFFCHQAASFSETSGVTRGATGVINLPPFTATKVMKIYMLNS
jgi:hypothetical protein